MKNKRTAKAIGILILVIALAVVGYHSYCHHMVSKFYKSVDEGNTEEIIACIEKMPDVNMLNKCRPLYNIEGFLTQYSNMKGYPLYYAIWKETDTSVIEALLNKGANPNKKSFSFSESPLRCLCRNPQKGLYEKVKLLVEHGADIDGTGLLFNFACSFDNCTEGSKEILLKTIIYLWEHGADERSNVGTEYENTVLHVAAEYMDIDYFGRLYNNDKRTMTDLLNMQDANGETPLFYAIRGEMFDNCTFLIEEGADTSIRNNEGKSVYDVAVELGYEDYIKIL
ncbi:MAG: ankyrin repeat domain-containing protein [Clostridiales bacterium]|nr:ankyrin repeat domain-containing protein [Clostridiales bacterium]